MRAIDADEVKARAYEEEKVLVGRYEETFGVTVDWLISKCGELPTMQSNEICDYCNHYETGSCPVGVPHFRCFEGKKVIEVTDD